MKLDPISQLYKEMLDKLEKPMFHKVPRHNFAHMENGTEVMPLVTLSDGVGMFHIIKDDGCYVLIHGYTFFVGPFGGVPIRKFRKATHWFPEAVKALGDYLKPKTICFDESHVCDAAEYAKGLRPDAMIQMVPETDASVARAALKTIAKDTNVVSAVRVQAAATLLAHRDDQ